jgi:hypothetical protein
LTPEPRQCAADDCSEVFVPKRKNNIYHDVACGQRTANSRRVRGAARISESLDDALEESRRRDLEQQSRQELKKATALESRIRRYLAVLEKSIEPYTPTPLVIEPVARKGKKTVLPEHETVLCTGDWHTGMKTRIHETGGIYEQNVQTTRDQVFRMWDRIQRLHYIDSHGVAQRKLHIIGLGDFIENDDMRPSQHRSIEDVMTVQTVQAFDLLAWLIRQCLTIYETVEVDLVGGNHDRTGQKRGNAGLGELDYADTMSWLIGEFTKRLFEDEPRISIRNWNTFFGYKKVADKRIVFEHGSSFKWGAGGYGGIPWYGVSQLPRKYAEMLGEADITIIGHGHRPAILPAGRGWQVLNGALPATSNYEQSSFKSVHRPLQWLLSVHKDHGLTSYKPLYLDVPGTVQPGEIWTDTEKYAELANERI